MPRSFFAVSSPIPSKRGVFRGVKTAFSSRLESIAVVCFDGVTGVSNKIHSRLAFCSPFLRVGEGLGRCGIGPGVWDWIAILMFGASIAPWLDDLAGWRVA